MEKTTMANMGADAAPANEEQKNGSWIKDLPKPVIPAVGTTLQRYLEGLKAVIPSAQYEQTKKTVEEFATQTAPLLQQDLIKFADQHENWVTGLWMDDMYLDNPIPLPINSSPYYLLPKQSFRSTAHHLSFAVKVLQFTHMFKMMIDNEEIPQEFGSGHASGTALCMNTYKHFFGCCRVPGPERDEFVAPQVWQQVNNTNNDHLNRIVVASRNQFFLLKLRHEDFQDPSLLMDCLTCISFLSKENEVLNNPAVGLLTTDNRRTWGCIRSHMIQNATNKASIEAIESSQFILCLDDQGIRSSSGSTKRRDFRRESIIRGNKHDHTPRCFNLLTGGGSELYTSNRWFDKFMQFVIGRDGTCGLLIEHSGSEGITLIRFLQQLLQFTTREDNFTSRSSSDHQLSDGNRRTNMTTISADMMARVRGKQVTELTFVMDHIILKGIQESGKRVDKLIQDLDLFIFTFKSFGKEFIKSQFMSPDAFIQLSLQLTHYKVHRKLVSSYESAGTRQFRFGRVDNIRSCTSEALHWARAMCDELPDVTEQQKVQLFQTAMAKQIEILKYTIAGHGPENHLLGLREMAKKRGLDVPLFKEKAYKEYLNFRLSTSQLPSQEDIVIGYGPVVPDGYGCSYNPCRDQINFSIASFFSAPETSSDFFARSLEGSLLQMREICQKIRDQNVDSNP